MAKPAWILSYENESVTDLLGPMVTGVTFTDHVHGKSDEVELTVEDSDSRWRGTWYPSEGDRIELKIGREGFPLLPCGSFSVDEIELGHSPRTAAIRGLAVPVSAPMRTVVTRGYDDTTLRAVVEQVASRHSMTVLGDIAELPFRRITQSREHDLAFLKRLAEQFGYAFNVRGPQLIFYPLVDLEAVDPVIVLTPGDLLPGTTWQGSSQHTYAACEVAYLDPETEQPIVVRVESTGVRRGATLAVSGGAAPVTAPSVVLRQGSPYKEEVRDWQTFLSGRGLYSGAIDGLFGPQTAKGTRSFQHSAGLATDAEVGPLTYAAAIDAGFVPSTGSTGGVSAVGDVLRINARVESAAEAEARAAAELHRANRLRVTGTLQLSGDERLMAGRTIEVVGNGRLSGRFCIDKSVHKLTRSGGYRTECEVAHVP